MISQRLLEDHFPNRPPGYFDHAAVGTVPASVADAVADVARALSTGVRGSADWHSRTDEALHLLAQDFGVPSSQLSVLANTSTAINSAARAVPLRKGARVLTFADDFPSPRLPWPAIENSVVVELAPGDDRTETLLAAIDSEVAVVSVTHVHATTGETLDLERLYAACQSAGALLMVDAAQSAGLLDHAAAHADVYVGASYKWLLAGFGAAVVATSERFDEVADPIFRGYRNPAPSPQLEVGHTSLFILAALQQAAAVRHEIGTDAIRDHTLNLVERIATETAGLGFNPLPNTRGAGIVSLDVPDPSGLHSHLAGRGITTAVREGKLRISPYLTTNEDDVDDLITALEQAPSNLKPKQGE